MTRPIPAKDLAARDALAPEGPGPDMTEADLAVFELPDGAEAELLRDERNARTYWLRVRGRGDGVRVEAAQPVAKAVGVAGEPNNSKLHTGSVQVRPPP